MIQRAGNKMLNGIERVREKPESTRVAVVVSLTLIAAAILIAFWFASLPKRFEPIARPAAADTERKTSYLSIYESLKKTAAALKNPEAAGEEIAEARPETPPAGPSRLGAWLQSARDIIALNLALIGAAFGDLRK